MKDMAWSDTELGTTCRLRCQGRGKPMKRIAFNTFEIVACQQRIYNFRGIDAFTTRTIGFFNLLSCERGGHAQQKESNVELALHVGLSTIAYAGTDQFVSF